MWNQTECQAWIDFFLVKRDRRERKRIHPAASRGRSIPDRRTADLGQSGTSPMNVSVKWRGTQVRHKVGPAVGGAFRCLAPPT